MTTKELDIEGLRKVAEEATPGPWVLQDGCSWRRIGTRDHDGNVLCPYNARHDHHPDLCAGRGEDVYANLRHITTFDPPTVLALLSELEAVKGENAALKASRDPAQQPEALAHPETSRHADGLADLISRVEKLEGPDREVDARLFLAFAHERLHQLVAQVPEEDRTNEWWVKRAADWCWHKPYTASLDAGLTLVERVLPGRACTVGKNLHHGHWVASVNELDGDGAPRSLGWGSGNAPALALILALLHALEANAEAEGSSRDHAPSDDGGASVRCAPLQPQSPKGAA